MASVSEFVREVAPYAYQASRETGLFPEVIISQWAVETGWGTSRLFREAKNPAGIKATTSWIGPTAGEYRAYPTMLAATVDYIRTVLSPLYSRVRAQKDPYSQAAALGASPWAEDPAYGTKLVSVLPKVQEALRSVSVLPYPLNLKGTEGLMTEEELRRRGYGGGSVWETLSPEEKRMVEEDLYQPGFSWLSPVRYVLRWVLIIAAGAAALYAFGQAFAPEVQAAAGAVRTVRKAVGR